MAAKTLGDNLKRFRKAAGFTPYRLGKLSTIDPGYIARIESGEIKSPGLPLLRKLAAGLHISLSELIGEKDRLERRPKNDRTEALIELKKVLDKIDLEDLEYVEQVLQVPVRGYVRAGTPSVIEQEDGENLIIAKAVVKAITSRPEQVYSLRISGESLSGDDIHTGDDILVLPVNDIEIEGKLYIIRDPATGETVARHLRRKNGRIRIESSNPKYQPLLLDQVEVIGRVIYVQPPGRAI